MKNLALLVFLALNGCTVAQYWTDDDKMQRAAAAAHATPTPTPNR